MKKTTITMSQLRKLVRESADEEYDDMTDNIWGDPDADISQVYIVKLEKTDRFGTQDRMTAFQAIADELEHGDYAGMEVKDIIEGGSGKSVINQFNEWMEDRIDD